MITASELRAGMALRLEGTLYMVLAADTHLAGGKMGGVTHVKLRNLETGTMKEWRFRPAEHVDEIEPERHTMQFLYWDGSLGYFMHPENFEQVAIERDRLGRAADFLHEGMSVPVQFVDEQAVGMVFPNVTEVRIADTAPALHTHGSSNVWKEAQLENGLTISVPPFIAPGEVVRVEVETGKYIERAKGGQPE